MTLAAQIRFAVLLVAVTVAGGCSSGTLPTGPGESVLGADAIAFTVESSGGGLVPPLPAGAACDPALWWYTVRFKTAEFIWDRCDVLGSYGDPASFSRSSGALLMPAADLDAARAMAGMVHVSGRKTCGADKLTLHLIVESQGGSTVYGDDFYACRELEEAYVISDELDGLVNYLRSYATATSE
jgi:hypothetical protein